MNRLIRTSWVYSLLMGVLFSMGLLFFAAPVEEASAQSARALVEEANRLYEEGRFDEAHQTYLEAMALDPDSPVIPFNDGNALYRGADYDRAVEAYGQAIEAGDPALASDAWYNLGNALYRQQQLQPSIEAYKQALRANPNDVDAKHNLERALLELQQRQQQQEEDPESEQDPSEQEQPPQPSAQPSPDSEEEQDRQPPPQSDDDEEGADDDRTDGGESEEQGDGDEEQPREDRPDPGEGSSGPGDPRPGQMSEEDARRLLDAIDEDPEEVNRRPPSARGRRPLKPW